MQFSSKLKKEKIKLKATRNKHVFHTTTLNDEFTKQFKLIIPACTRRQESDFLCKQLKRNHFETFQVDFDNLKQLAKMIAKAGYANHENLEFSSVSSITLYQIEKKITECSRWVTKNATKKHFKWSL